MPRNQTVQLFKTSKNALNPDIMRKQIDDITRRAIGVTLVKRGWRVKPFEIGITANGDNITHYALTLTYFKRQQRERAQSDDVFDEQFAGIAKRTVQYARASGWQPSKEQATPEVAKAVGTIIKEFRIELPADIKPYFAHLFDRDAQIRLIHASLRAAISSKFQVRNHCMLYGQAACGKTDTLEAFMRLVGEDNSFKLDAPQMTKAGAENLLLELDEIPPILIIEEMEKTLPANLPWLLGVMDQRAKIMKTNARIGHKEREARCLVMATVNDIKLFNSLMSGALSSRFAHKIYFPRPDRKVLQLILRREVHKLQGDERWIEPVLDYLLEKENNNDPRRAIALLDGRERLLDGSYQADLQTMERSRLKDEDHRQKKEAEEKSTMNDPRTALLEMLGKIMNKEN